MRAGVLFAPGPWLSLTEQVELAVLADNLGLDSVWVPEGDGRDAVAVLGLLAGRTRRITLVAGVHETAGGERHAVSDAAAATLDALSGGRFRLATIPDGQDSQRLDELRLDDGADGAEAEVVPVLPVALDEDEDAARTAAQTWRSRCAGSIATTPAQLDERLAAYERDGVGLLVAIPCGRDPRAVVRALAAATRTR